MRFPLQFGLMLGAVLLLAVTGCVPASSSDAEENEAHYLKGKARASSLDYRGAIEAFEEALVVNPRSGAAHFQLGWIYAEREADPAAAIYHYQKFLQLRPAADNAEVIRQHIFRLKQDLVKGLMPLPATPGVQREFEQLAQENRRLREELERLQGFLTARGFSLSNPVVVLPETRSQPPGGGLGNRGPVAGGGTNQIRNPALRTHRVQSGESPSAIARKYDVRLEALLAANPGLNPRRLQVGQVLNVPPP